MADIRIRANGRVVGSSHQKRQTGTLLPAQTCAQAMNEQTIPIMNKSRSLKNFLKNKPLFIIIVVLIAALVTGWLFHSHSVVERKARRAKLPHLLPTVKIHDVGNASSLTTFTPSTPKKTMVIAMPVNNEFSNKRLRKLSFDASATIVKIELSANDCLQRLRVFDEAVQRFAPTADIVVALDEDAALAQHWLSLQTDEQAAAVSATSDNAAGREKDTCMNPNAVLPMKGTWHNITSNTLTVWENGVPTDITAPVTPKKRLTDELETYLRHNLLNIPELSVLNKLPVIELPAMTGSDTLVLFYSGDGGWRGIDKKMSGNISGAGISVVGVDVLDYYWDFKTPEQSALELSQLMAHYRQAWGIKHFVIAGYSFGADVLPALYNRLPAHDQADIGSIILLSFARSANFEIRIEGMIGKDAGKFPTAPEMARLPADKVLCVYGTEEARKSGCTDSAVVGKVLPFPGNHHFNEEYETVANHLIEFIKRPSEQ